MPHRPNKRPSVPPFVMGGGAFMMRHLQPPSPHPAAAAAAGLVHHPLARQWGQQPLLHSESVPRLMSAGSSDASTVDTDHNKDETKDASPFESPEEAAASALLLAHSSKQTSGTNASRDEDDQEPTSNASAETSQSKENPSSAGSRSQAKPEDDDKKDEEDLPPLPLKKRKKQHILRQSHQEPDPTPTEQHATPSSQLPCHVSPASSSSVTTMEHSDVPHFPSVLHSVLTLSEFAGPVLEWLPHGWAWKVHRWDALRREVLPRFFPQLRDEDGKGAGSIDAFLGLLRSWGFEEIKRGPDIGAYYHLMFRREYPKLCRQMTAGSHETSPKSVGTLDSSPDTLNTPHSLLRVPSLASARSDMESDNKLQAKSSTWGRAFGAWPMEPSIHYRPDDPRPPMRYAGAFDGVAFPYSPPRVRSGRGAMRGVGRIPSQQHQHPTVFVSNRGGKGAARRPGRMPTATSNRAAVAVSRKTKRKLPLAASRKETPAVS